MHLFLALFFYHYCHAEGCSCTLLNETDQHDTLPLLIFISSGSQYANSGRTPMVGP